jgi:hypothetical protein
MTTNAIPKPFQFCFLLVPPTNSYKNDKWLFKKKNNNFLIRFHWNICELNLNSSPHKKNNIELNSHHLPLARVVLAEMWTSERIVLIVRNKHTNKK